MTILFRKHMGVYKKLIQVFFFFCFFGGAVPAWPGVGVKVLGSSYVWPEFTRVALAAMVPFGEKLKTRDYNFKEDGVTGFTGIRISRLMELAGRGLDKGLTVIGSDQYVAYLSQEKLEEGFLVWEMNGKSIAGLKGGPLKLIFPQSAGLHSSCYTWYVEALVAGTGQGARLRVTQGQKTRQYGLDELLTHAVDLDPAWVSIAQGCRNDFQDPAPAIEIKAVPISWFLSGTPEYQGGRAGAVQLIPLAGPMVTLGPEILNYPVFVVVSRDNRGLHPALGGPFLVVFPIEIHPELRDMVPESGALFFLEKINIIAD